MSKEGKAACSAARPIPIWNEGVLCCVPNPRATACRQMECLLSLPLSPLFPSSAAYAANNPVNKGIKALRSMVGGDRKDI